MLLRLLGSFSESSVANSNAHHCLDGEKSRTSAAQARNNEMETELTNLEKEFSQAIMSNNAKAVEPFLAADWVIIDPDGGVIDKSRFLEVIDSGALSHDTMESEDFRVRVYGNTAVVTALTKTKGKFMGQGFSTQERATDVFVKQDGRWQCVISQLTRFIKK
jgi:ketosteroid isomerase-like protein